MDLLGTKILAMCILGIVSFIVGLSTVTLRNLLGLKKTGTTDTQTKVTSLLLCFGAGVLLATTLLHILPEMRERMEEAEQNLGVEWLAELVLCFGFFSVYLLEEVVHLVLSRTKHTEQLHRALSVRKSGVEKTVNDQDSACNNGPKPDVSSCCNKEGQDSCHNDMERDNKVDEVAEYDPEAGKKGKRQLVADNSGNHHSHLISAQSDSFFRDFITVLALSFHCLLEGMAVGLEEDKAGVLALFFAISCHKFVIAFCISLELLQSGTKLKVFIIYLFAFSFNSSLGIGIGMSILSLPIDEGNRELTVATLQGLAGGTLLYVVMFEVIQREKSKEVIGLLQLFAIVMGFGTMVLIGTFVKEREDEDEEGGYLMLNSTFQPPSNSLRSILLQLVNWLEQHQGQDFESEGKVYGVRTLTVELLNQIM